jgi:hypothetical protein
MTAQTISTTLIAARTTLAATGFARPRQDSPSSKGRGVTRKALRSRSIATPPTFVRVSTTPHVRALQSQVVDLGIVETSFLCDVSKMTQLSRSLPVAIG